MRTRNTVLPVVDALTDGYHPCQAISFAQMSKEQISDYKGQMSRLCIGSGNNVAELDLSRSHAKLGMELRHGLPRMAWNGHGYGMERNGMPNAQ